MAYRITAYQTNDGRAPDAEEWAALIRVEKHVGAWAFGATEAEAIAKAEAHMAAQAAKKSTTGRKAANPPAITDADIEEAI